MNLALKFQRIPGAKEQRLILSMADINLKCSRFEDSRQDNRSRCKYNPCGTGEGERGSEHKSIMYFMDEQPFFCYFYFATPYLHLIQNAILSLHQVRLVRGVPAIFWLHGIVPLKTACITNTWISAHNWTGTSSFLYFFFELIASTALQKPDIVCWMIESVEALTGRGTVAETF